MKIRFIFFFIIFLVFNYKINLNGEIFLTNNTNGALQIIWLSSENKVLSNKDLILTGQTNKKHITPKNARKFKVIWGGGSIVSNSINIIQNDYYQAICLPNNYSCDQIILENTNLQISKNKSSNPKLIVSTNLPSIYLKNETKNQFILNWYDINGILLSSNKVLNNQTHQKINIVANSSNFTVSNTTNTVSSIPTPVAAEQLFQITCTVVNNICSTITVTQVALPTRSTSNNINTTATNIIKSGNISKSAIPVISSRISGSGYSASDDTSLDTMLPDYSSSNAVSVSGVSKTSNSLNANISTLCSDGTTANSDGTCNDGSTPS